MSSRQAGRPGSFLVLAGETVTGTSRWRFWPLPQAGGESTEEDKHVESCGGVLSDAGSTPAASTSFPQCLLGFQLSVPAASTIPPTLDGLPVSSSRIADSTAAGLKCMYRWVVVIL